MDSEINKYNNLDRLEKQGQSPRYSLSHDAYN